MNVTELRSRLALTQVEFARLVGADVRSVARWEAQRSRPTGGSRVVIQVLRVFLEKRPEDEADLKILLARYASIGGLAYMIVDLIERSLTDGEERKKTA